jgi:hypothetical protein
VTAGCEVEPLCAWQDAFAAALLADAPAVGAPAGLAALVRQPGFAVYRNTVLAGCIDALQANFPSVARLVGDEWFRAAAAAYARGALPTEPSLLVYGASFPDFLAAFVPARELPYLADVAAVDRLWTEAHVAADADALAPTALAALAPAAMASHGLVLHPATRWRWSDEWPIHALWQRQRDGLNAAPAAFDWTGEGVLLTRPVGAVQVEALGRGGLALLAACAAGASIEAAALAALDAEDGLDLAGLVRQLLQAGAFSGLQPLSRKEDR